MRLIGRRVGLVGVLLCWVWLMVGCQAISNNEGEVLLDSEPVAEPLPSPTPHQLTVQFEQLVVEMGERGLTAVVRGKWNDECITLTPTNQQRTGNNIDLTVTAVRQSDSDCPTNFRPFSEQILLSTTDLPDGYYILTLNQTIQAAFPFQIAMLQGNPDLPDALAISGGVWHDLCTGREEAGCVSNGRGGWRADGQRQAAEPPIPLVTLLLNRGSCPGDGTLQITRTDQQGAFRLGGLIPGAYCLIVDAGQENNRLVLGPGEWTAPAEAVGRQRYSTTIVLPDDGAARNLAFGWDYELLPRPASGQNCDNQALLIEALNYEQAPLLQPGQTVVKRWLVQNVGTCSWDSNYQLVAVPPGLSSPPQPVPQTVVPGETIELSVPLVAPTAPGLYSGRWFLQDGAGRQFGFNITGTAGLTAELRVPAPVTQPTSEPEE